VFAVLLAAVLPVLVPQPQTMEPRSCAGGGLSLAQPLAVARDIDPGGLEIVRERWKALGIPAPDQGSERTETSAHPRVRSAPRPLILRTTARGRTDGTYAIDIDETGVRIAAATDEGAFDALATLAQLPVKNASAWLLPCVHIDDRPALRVRAVSDDISRGPFPTESYFKARIRALAALKINAYSVYMEGVFADSRFPFVATPNALTAAEVRELAGYARRFHVAFIPEQQTFAHMHEVLKYETFATMAETPHGYLVAQSDPLTYAYLDPLLRAEAAAAAPVPFFHLGVDEPIDLGRGLTPRTPQVIADHVKHVAADVAGPHTRPIIWDDAIQADPSILTLIPKNIVIATFHYGAEPSFAKYIATVKNAGFDQLVSPGANNWNEIFPDLNVAYANESQFLADGKSANVLGMFETVWHDDGETLYDATWAPVAFAAATAWQRGPVDRAAWHRTFARVFFGTDDPRFGLDFDLFESIDKLLTAKSPRDPSDYLFWADPFDERIATRTAPAVIATLRSAAETIVLHLSAATPPLHPEAARAMLLAARRYDDLGRRFQIGAEVRALYADAQAHAATHDDTIVYRDLNQAKYFCWELRDELTGLEPDYAAAWTAESTRPGLDRILVKYRRGEARAQAVADRLDAVQREDYLRGHTLPPFDEVLASAR
jgi:hypothetical protein